MFFPVLYTSLRTEKKYCGALNKLEKNLQSIKQEPLSEIQ